jgi:hypothetical protein
MDTVCNWAGGIGADYEFIDDALFDAVPDWYLQKAKGAVTVVTDLARLVVARNYLADGYDRAIWVDADVVAFAPEHLAIPEDWPFAFCREVWVRLDSDGALVFTQKTNNALCAFHASDTRFLNHYIDACEIMIRDREEPLEGAEVGTEYLTALQQIMRFPVLQNVGLLSPLLMNEIATGGERLTAHYVTRLGGSLGAANLCASLAGRTIDGVTLTEAFFDTVIDRLLTSRGSGLNKWADLDSQLELARSHIQKGEHNNAVNLLMAIGANAQSPSEPMSMLADIYVQRNEATAALERCRKVLIRNPFDERGVALNQALVEKAGILDRSATFGDIYHNSEWGSDPDKIYFSGPGSRRDACGAYCTFVSDFIGKNGIASVVDLGCGDYTVGGQIDMSDADYTGVDVFPDLITLNSETHGSETVRFVRADIVEDELPAGDLCLIRQVLQHLSNADIQRVLLKLTGYRYVLITDGQSPIPSARRRNLDKQTGRSTRGSLFNNGLWLELPPFNLPADVVLEYPIKDGEPPGEILRTLLIENQL